MKKILKAPVWLLKHIEEIIASTALAVMVLSCSYNVLMRYIFHNPPSWADEIMILCLAWTTFLGGAAAYKRNMHFGMEFFLDKLSQKGKYIMRQIITLILLVLCAYLTVISIQFTSKVTSVMNFTQLSYRWMYSAAVTALASMSIYSLKYFIQSFISPNKFEAHFAPNYTDDNLEAAEQGANEYEAKGKENEL